MPTRHPTRPIHIPTYQELEEQANSYDDADDPLYADEEFHYKHPILNAITWIAALPILFVLAIPYWLADLGRGKSKG